MTKKMKRTLLSLSQLSQINVEHNFQEENYDKTEDKAGMMKDLTSMVSSFLKK